MPKARRPRIYERLLIRPRTWAGTPVEPPAVAVCLSILVLIFAAEIRTPSSVVGILAIFPLMIATWMLSRWPATAVLASAIFLVVAEMAAKAIDGLTGATELVAMISLAAVVRLYASRLDLLFPRLHRPGIDRLMTRLSKREREIVRLTVEGHTAPQIARLLHISERTVETHLANAYGKLGISSKFDLVRRAAS